VRKDDSLPLFARSAVARFLDRCAALNEVKSTREQMTTAAVAIRGGRMPEFYQY
jgi:hypothetical protein